MTPQDPRGARRGLDSEYLRPLILIVIVFVLWDVVIRIFRIPPYLIPAPWAVAKMLVAEWPRLLRESLVTGYATLGGFGLSILFGIPMAMLIAYSRTGGELCLSAAGLLAKRSQDRDRAAVRGLVRFRHFPEGHLARSCWASSRSSSPPSWGSSRSSPT